MRAIKSVLSTGCLIVLLAAAIGCNGRLWTRTPRDPVIRTDQFVIVTTTAGDTGPALAKTHLGDASKERHAAGGRLECLGCRVRGAL